MRKILNLVNDVQNASVLSCFFVLFSIFNTTLAKCVLCFVFCVAVSALVRVCARNIKKNSISLLCAVSIAIFCFFVLKFADMHFMAWIFSIGVFVWLMVFRYAKFADGEKGASGWFVIVFLFAAVVGNAFYLKTAVGFFLISAIIFMCLNIFSKGIYANEVFIKENKNLQNFPEERIRRTYITLLSAFCTVCLLVSAVAVTAKNDNSQISEFVSNALHNFYEMLPKTESKSFGKEEEQLPSSNTDYAAAARDFGVYKTTNEAVERIGTIVAIVLLALAVLIFLIWIFGKTIKTLMLSKKIGADETEFILSNDKAENAFEKQKKNLCENYSEMKKIRKMYKKYVLKNAEHITRSDTPQLIEKRINKNDKEQITKIYERVRYSNKKCTKEDIKEMKKALSHIEK